MEIKKLFPTPVYINHNNNLIFNDYFNKLQNKIENEDINFNIESYGFGYTSYFTNNNLQSYPETRDLCLSIIKNCREYMIALGYEEDIEFGITSLWVSRQEKGAEHQLHNHRMSFISGTYYSLANEHCARLMFQSPLEHLKMNWPVSDVDSEYNRDDEYITPNSGTMILFPSFLNHLVEKHTITTERIAWSFNINLIRY
jgi:uncharacterized protein (TIGR02466 family)